MGIIAAGGIGKSGLVDAWVQKFKIDYQGLLFGWSFYSQGAHDTQTSSTLFFEAALPFFGYVGEPLTDDTTKGRKLAELLRNQPSILVLDGVEPLQNSVVVDGGRLKDLGLAALLRDVRQHGLNAESLIIVTSRQSLVEFQECENYQPLDLLRLATEDGAALLKHLGVEGLKPELQAAVEAYGGHALALVLLGKLLVEYYEADVNQYERLPILEDNEDIMVGHHAERVMQFYAQQWGVDAPEQCFLNLLGLFDRPMETGALQVLSEQAEIAVPLAGLAKIKWKKMLVRLRKAGLLLEARQDSYDTHPLIRNYFGEQLKTQNPSAWQQAHLVLFEYFQSVPDKKQPDTLQELEPLYRAVKHGCLAGEFQKADKIYFERILRNSNEAYSFKRLGSYSQDLTTIAAFFPESWEKPVSYSLPKETQGWLLLTAPFCLMSLGRLAEAIKTRQISIKIYKELEGWKNVVTASGILVNLFLSIGQLVDAKQIAQQAVKFADVHTNNKFSQMGARVQLAITLHRLGYLELALKQFQAAEKIQYERQSQYPKLYSVQGVWYCLLLLDLATSTVEQETVLKREQTIHQWAEQNDEVNLFPLALHHLIIARSLFALNRIEEAAEEFEQAVNGIRKAGSIMNLPEFLFRERQIPPPPTRF